MNRAELEAAIRVVTSLLEEADGLRCEVDILTDRLDELTNENARLRLELAGANTVEMAQ